LKNRDEEIGFDFKKIWGPANTLFYSGAAKNFFSDGRGGGGYIEASVGFATNGSVGTPDPHEVPDDLAYKCFGAKRGEHLNQWWLGGELFGNNYFANRSLSGNKGINLQKISNVVYISKSIYIYIF
jgi:hypothetical protein